MAKNDAPVVQIDAGRLRGAWKSKGGVAVFRGVPYAAPPVGARRWKAPEPVVAWDGIRSATKDGPIALQRATLIEDFLDAVLSGQGWSAPRVAAMRTLVARAPRPRQSEDCLTLAVRTPSVDPQSKLPVMVWFHGGDHQDGAGSEPYYASNALAELGVVSVAINYRLGLMGYYAHPELMAESARGVAGNYGTLDQIAALEWVRDNIAAFGGDPDNVTIFGESAGGESVVHMMTSPLATGLFHRAIAQSAANARQMLRLDEPFEDQDPATQTSLAFADALAIRGPDQLSRLRELSADALMALVRSAPRLGDHYPCIDGHVLPESPLAAFAGGRQAGVPLIVGTNADEGSIIQPTLGATMIDFRYRPEPEGALQPEMIAAFGDDLDRLVGVYPGLDRGESAARVEFCGDHMFGGRAYWYARHHHAHGHPTWLYLFARTPPSAKQTAGAFHAAELPFVHGSSVPILPLTADDKQLGATMRDYWTSLARSGDPNAGGRAAVPWPRFDDAAPAWMRFDHDLRSEPVDRVERYEVLNARTARLVADMAELDRSVVG